MVFSNLSHECLCRGIAHGLLKWSPTILCFWCFYKWYELIYFTVVLLLTLPSVSFLNSLIKLSTFACGFFRISYVHSHVVCEHRQFYAFLSNPFYFIYLTKILQWLRLPVQYLIDVEVMIAEILALFLILGGNKFLNIKFDIICKFFRDVFY